MSLDHCEEYASGWGFFFLTRFSEGNAKTILDSMLAVPSGVPKAGIH